MQLWFRTYQYYFDTQNSKLVCDFRRGQCLCFIEISSQVVNDCRTNFAVGLIRAISCIVIYIENERDCDNGICYAILNTGSCSRHD